MIILSNVKAYEYFAKGLCGYRSKYPHPLLYLNLSEVPEFFFLHYYASVTLLRKFP